MQISTNKVKEAYRDPEPVYNTCSLTVSSLTIMHIGGYFFFALTCTGVYYMVCISLYIGIHTDVLVCAVEILSLRSVNLKVTQLSVEHTCSRE